MEPEEQTPNNLTALVKNAPAVRQVLLLVGLAISIGLGLAAAFWLRDAGYTTLYANVSDIEAAEIVSTLQTSGIEFQIDRSTGAIKVPPGTVREARMALASAGLPRGAGFGMEIIQAESGITSSQFMENARYHQALQTELARTISLLNPVQSARVHLGLPESTVFIRDRRERTASVTVNLYPGRSLEPSQVDAIVHIVAFSVPELDASNVSVVDQTGRRLSQSGQDDELALSERQLDYVRRLEEDMENNIVRMLARLVGPENVQATVTAEVDFTVQEESREQYDPASAVVRSEEIQENRNSVGGTTPAGVPGALSNTPPQVGAAAAAGGAGQAAPGQNAAGSESVHQVRNFEVDRTMSVTRRPSGSTTRLSIAVVLNEAIGAGDDEDAEAADPNALSELVAEAEQLVRGAVAFNEARGDTLTVQTAQFYVPPPEPEVEAPSFFTSPTFLSWLRQGASIAAILLVGFGLARPIVRMLTAPAPEPPRIAGALEGGMGAAASPMQLSYDDKVGAVRQLVDRDSERVARIVRQWVGQDG